MTFDISNISIPKEPGIYLMKDSKNIFFKESKLQNTKTCFKDFWYRIFINR